MKFETLDSWRDYFRTSNACIFDIIEKAITVAASDCPKEFRVMRDRVAETLFSSKFTKCSGCDRVELSAKDETKGGGDFGGSKESKAVSSSNRGGDQVEEMNMNQVSNYSYGEAEASIDEIEQEGQIVGEVLRIKDILDNKSQDESDPSVLFESLKKLLLMPGLSVDSLKSTEIGKSVNVLRKHSSKDIRILARTLIELWRVMVDEWVNATADVTPESVNPSVVKEEEEKDDKFSKVEPNNEPHVPETVHKQDDNNKKQEILMKMQSGSVEPNRPSNTESGPGRPIEANLEQKIGCGTKIQQKLMIQKKPQIDQQHCLDHATKLEETKRKLQQGYQAIENAKKQKTIQMMQLHEIPKRDLTRRPLLNKPGNWANGRH